MIFSLELSPKMNLLTGWRGLAAERCRFLDQALCKQTRKWPLEGQHDVGQLSRKR